MDEKDVQILGAVAEHKTASPVEIHEITGIPKSTVHYRLDELRNEGVIRDNLLNVDLTEVGLSMTLVTHVWAEYGDEYHERVGEKIAEINGVNQVHFVLGETDFIVISHIPSREQVEELVGQFEAIDEIERTSSTFVIKTLKDEPAPLNDYPVEDLVDVLDTD